MNNSDLRLLCVYVAPTEGEIVSDYLWSRGVVAIEEIDHGYRLQLRTSYGDEVGQLAHDVVTAFPHVDVSITDARRDVADNWREFAKPIEIDSSLRIVPSWLDEETPPGSTDIFIDPEDVFGLGNHPTTIGALRLGRHHIPSNSTLFDFGSGSGVLAIAMVKTHHCTAAVYDIADNAEDVISRNALRNNVEVRWHTPSAVSTSHDSRHEFDVVMANILAPVLREIAPAIRQMTHLDSLVVLSGMRTDQWESVRTQYTWCNVVDQCEIEGWLSVCLRVTTA